MKKSNILEKLKSYWLAHPYQVFCAISIFPQWLSVQFLSKHPQLVETYYSNGFYPIISKILRYLLGWIPFSVGDIIYTVLALLFLFWIVRRGRILWRSPLTVILKGMMGLSFIYFLFHFLWGINYYRPPLHESLNLPENYSTIELTDFLERIIKKSNDIHRQIVQSDTVIIDISYTKQEILEKVSLGYKALSKQFTHWSYHPTSIKPSIYSTILTYMGYSGYLNPFTGEAQVNERILKYNYPIVSCHEVAHQLGFSAENEANFVGYLAAVSHPDKYFQYAAYTFALRYTLSELRKRAPKQYKNYLNKVNTGIIAHYREQYTFWKFYENPAEPVLKKTYNAYLKANRQTKGIQSYNYVVSLLVNYYKEHSL